MAHSYDVLEETVIPIDKFKQILYNSVEKKLQDRVKFPTGGYSPRA